MDVLGFRVESAQRAKRRDQRAHRVRILGHRVEQAGDPRRRHPILVNHPRPVAQLGRGRQLALQQQVGGLEIRALFGELLDRIPAVSEDALVAVDIGDAAATGRRVDERWVIADQPEVLRAGAHLAQVRGADRPVLDRELGGAAGTVVGQRQRVRHRVAGARRVSGLGWWFVPVVGIGGNRVAGNAVPAVHPSRKVQQLAPFAAKRAPRGVDGLPSAVRAHRSGDGRHLDILWVAAVDEQARPLCGEIENSRNRELEKFGPTDARCIRLFSSSRFLECYPRQFAWRSASGAWCRTSRAETRKMTSSAMLVA